MIWIYSEVIPFSSAFLLAAQLLPFDGDSRAFSSIVAVFSDTNTCLAIYLVGKFVGDFSTSKLTGSPKMYKQHPLTMLQNRRRGCFLPLLTSPAVNM